IGLNFMNLPVVKFGRRTLITVALLAGGLTVALMVGWSSKATVKDPRLQSPRVEVFKAKAAGSNGRTFTGIVEARVQSDLGFRVAGKILQRSVDVGQRVLKGQPLMRLDPEDLRLSAAAQQANVEAARAKYTQAKADETRSGMLVKSGVISPREYDQERAAVAWGPPGGNAPARPASLGQRGQGADAASRTGGSAAALACQAARAPPGPAVTIALLSGPTSRAESVLAPVGAIYGRGGAPGV